MRQTTWIVAVVLVGVVALGATNLATAAKKKDTGQELYKEFCKPCHTAESEHGEYTPMTLIQDQWERFFAEKYQASHDKVTDPNNDNRPVTEIIGDEVLAKIKEFAVDHAADSEHPMTCG